MQMSRWPLMATLAALAVGVGCRQAEPPEFTPGPDVVELTEGLDPEEDKEDLKTLQDLQAHCLQPRPHESVPQPSHEGTAARPEP